MITDDLGRSALQDQPAACCFRHRFNKFPGGNLLFFYCSGCDMNFIPALPGHKKMRVQHPDPLFPQGRSYLFLQTFVRENTVFQLSGRTLYHIRKSIHLNRTPFPAPGHPVNPDHILPGVMESFQHFPQKSGRHDAPLHQLSLCFCIQFIPIVIDCRKDLIPHLVRMDKVFSPAPAAFFTFSAYLFADTGKHSLDLFIRKRLPLFFQSEKCLRQLFQ